MPIITEDIANDLGLTPEQVSGLNSFLAFIKVKSVSELEAVTSTTGGFIPFQDGAGIMKKLSYDNLISTFAVGYKDSLKISDAAPTAVGLYGLEDVGTYINLGGIVAQSGKLNFASFDGTTWSLVVVGFPIGLNSFDENSTTHIATMKPTADYVKTITNEIKSGQINDGSIDWEKLNQSTKDLINAAGNGTITNLPDEVDLTTKNNRISLKNGGFLGLIFVRDVVDLNKLIDDGVAGCWMISREINLNKNITIPDGVTIYSNGGVINIGDYNVTFSNTKFEHKRSVFFKKNGNGNFLGTIDNDIVFPEWFGAKGDGITLNDDYGINACLSLTQTKGCNLILGSGKNYVINRTIKLYSNQHIYAHGAYIKMKVYGTAFHNIGYENNSRTSNIGFFGGTYDRENYSSTGYSDIAIIIHHNDNLFIKDAKFLGQSGKYIFGIGDTKNSYFSNLNFDCASDSIHLLGKNYKTYISDITAIGGDDIVAVTTEDYVAYKFEEGEVEDLEIKNIDGNNHTRIVLLGNTKYTIKNVTIDNVIQRGTGAIVNIGDGGELVDTQTAFVDNIKMSNLKGFTPANQILLRHFNIGNIEINNTEQQIYLARETNGNCGVEKFVAKNVKIISAEPYVTKMTNVYINNATDVIILAGTCEEILIENSKITAGSNAITFNNSEVNNAIIKNCKIKTTYTGNDEVIKYKGVINNIRFENCMLSGGSTNAPLIVSEGNSYIKNLYFINCSISLIKGLYSSTYTTSVDTYINLSNVVIEQTNRILEILNTNNIFFSYSNVKINSITNEPFRFVGTHKLTIYGNGWNATKQSIVGFTNVDCYAQDLPCDLANVNKIIKGRAYNTNASLSCGIGYVICDGTNWKNLFTGLTY